LSSAELKPDGSALGPGSEFHARWRDPQKAARGQRFGSGKKGAWDADQEMSELLREDARWLDRLQGRERQLKPDEKGVMPLYPVTRVAIFLPSDHMEGEQPPEWQQDAPLPPCFSSRFEARTGWGVYCRNVRPYHLTDLLGDFEADVRGQADARFAGLRDRPAWFHASRACPYHSDLYERRYAGTSPPVHEWRPGCTCLPLSLRVPSPFQGAGLVDDLRDVRDYQGHLVYHDGALESIQPLRGEVGIPVNGRLAYWGVAMRRGFDEASKRWGRFQSWPCNPWECQDYWAAAGKKGAPCGWKGILRFIPKIVYKKSPDFWCLPTSGFASCNNLATAIPRLRAEVAQADNVGVLIGVPLVLSMTRETGAAGRRVGGTDTYDITEYDLGPLWPVEKSQALALAARERREALTEGGRVSDDRLLESANAWKEYEEATDREIDDAEEFGATGFRPPSEPGEVAVAVQVEPVPEAESEPEAVAPPEPEVLEGEVVEHVGEEEGVRDPATDTAEEPPAEDVPPPEPDANEQALIKIEELGSSRDWEVKRTGAVKAAALEDERGPVAFLEAFLAVEAVVDEIGITGPEANGLRKTLGLHGMVERLREAKAAGALQAIEGPSLGNELRQRGMDMDELMKFLKSLGTDEGGQTKLM